MKKNTLLALLACMLLPACVFAGDTWKPVAARNVAGGSERYSFTAYRTYFANEAALKQALHTASKGIAPVVELPMPDGSFRMFRVSANTLLPAGLASRYPGIACFNAVATDDDGLTAKLDFTAYGFHAMIYDGERTALIDPAGNSRDGYYTVHYKRDETAVVRDGCTAQPGADADKLSGQLKPTLSGLPVVNGGIMRRYRLALACSHQYAQTVTGQPAPTKADVLSKMATSINRVNGIYEAEMAVSMQFVENEDTIIYTVAAGDPFGVDDDLKNASGLAATNQLQCDTLIGDLNYDIGHVFSRGGGGLAQVGAVCRQGLKAQGVTGSETPYGDGYDVDYVAHEIGHEFGANHTFNNNRSSFCNGNGVPLRAFEPGSGSTVMAYAGICSPDNLQPHSDFYFHAISLQEIFSYITTQGDVCALKTATGYKSPGVPSFSASYTMPSRTPFELEALRAVDSTGDSALTYCWEQWDLGGFGLTLPQTDAAGPLFRSYTPVKSQWRVFPDMKMVRNGILSNAGTNNASGEKVPEATRSLMFRLTVRAAHAGSGSFNVSPDSVLLYAINTGEGFRVTSQNTPGISYDGYSQQLVTWAKAGSDIAPVNTPRVDIFLSADGGYTWPYFLGTFPNTGEANVSMPNPDIQIDSARIKVKGSGNVFFNINSRDFKVTHNYEAGIRIYPVPAHNNLHVEAKESGLLEAVVFNAVGQTVWQGEINGEIDLPAYLWARGVYVIKFMNAANNRIVRKFVVN